MFAELHTCRSSCGPCSLSLVLDARTFSPLHKVACFGMLRFVCWRKTEEGGNPLVAFGMRVVASEGWQAPHHTRQRMGVFSTRGCTQHAGTRTCTRGRLLRTHVTNGTIRMMLGGQHTEWHIDCCCCCGGRTSPRLGRRLPRVFEVPRVFVFVCLWRCGFDLEIKSVCVEKMQQPTTR